MHLPDRAAHETPFLSRDQHGLAIQVPTPDHDSVVEGVWQIELQKMGVAAVLGQDTTPEKIVETIKACAPVQAGF